jgi:transcriptional regulator with XRE-family HTH domain
MAAQRNYIKELHELGLTYKQIAKETGYSRDMVASISIGRRRIPKSSTKRYEAIRNAVRRATYAEARKRGLPSKAARKLRRELPEEIKKTSGKVWEVKETITGVKEYQLTIVGDFYSEKQKEYAYDIKCYSAAHTEVDFPTMISECEANGQAQLGGSDWKLVKIKSRVITEIRVK